ncbi:MAG: hypothetical protein QOK10_3175, partial [Pseudonocardiales bacterium]|nr:hypothetical protein [Pseudonocardiales bacterium]
MSAAVTVTLLVAGTFGGGAAAAPLPLTGGSATTSTSQDVCGTPAPGYLRCLAIRKTDASEPAGLSAHANAGVVPNVTPRGYGPSDLAAAYQLDPNGGSGQTVALVDAFDSPTVESDLAVYRAQYGLPACTTLNSCFRKVNQAGAASPLPAANSGWAAEIALDVEMVSAVCPQCNILLVEARTNYTSDLGSAVDTAVALGAKFVSNSYGGGDSTSQGSHFDHPGVAITASTGDNGYGVSFPASVPTVTAVGGTSLTRAATSRGWAESTWSGSGSGCSGAWGKPAIQTLVNTGCTNRAVADVSAVADPNTGVAVYDAGSWMVLGGTSASSPIIAAVYALAGTPGAGDYPNTYPYEYSDSVNDVTVGTNGSCGGSPLCTARAGWDGPTGLGTPAGAAAFSASGVVGPPTKLGAALTVNNPAIPGIGTQATVTPILPDGHSVTSIRWKSGRTDCVFSAPSSRTTTVTCPAKASGTTTVTATVLDSAQASRAVTVPLVFNTGGAKRDLAVTFGLAGQSGSSQSVCTSASTPVVATVTDAATGSPVMGIPVSFSRQTGSLNPVGLPGANTGADGRATVSISTATPLTLASRTTAVGPFNAFAGSSFGITASRCTPDLTATTNLTSTYYGDPVTVTGTLTRALGTGVVPVG